VTATTAPTRPGPAESRACSQANAIVGPTDTQGTTAHPRTRPLNIRRWPRACRDRNAVVAAAAAVAVAAPTSSHANTTYEDCRTEGTPNATPHPDTSRTRSVGPKTGHRRPMTPPGSGTASGTVDTGV